MRSRRALIFDRDKDFIDRLRRCLRLLDVAVDVAGSRRGALEQLESDIPAIVFIAVERPKKSGFKAFTDVKQRCRKVPIVLTSSTVPMAELLLHQKLRLHADAYVDKRGTTEREVLHTLNELLPLNLEAEELVALARRARSTRIPSAPDRDTRTASRRAVVVSRPVASDDDDGDAFDDESEDGLAVADPAVAALLGDVDMSPVIVGCQDAEVGLDAEEDDDEFGYPEEIASLQEELRRLERELEQAKRAAGSSPFSSDYLELKERADAEVRRNARLRREHGTRARQVEALRAKLLQIADRVLQVERQRDQSLEQVRELGARRDLLADELRQAQERNGDLTRRLEEETRGREDYELRNARELESFKNRLADEMRQAIDVEERHGQELAAAEQRHQAARAEALEEQRRRLDEDRQQFKRECEATAESRIEAQRKEQLAIIEAKDAEWQRKLDDLQRRHEGELEARREDHRKQLAELHGSLEQALLRKDNEIDQVRAEAAEGERLQQDQASEFEGRARELRLEYAQALEARTLEYEERLDELRREHASALDAQREEHRRRIDRTAAAHHQALAERDRQQAEAVEQALAEARREYVREAGRRLEELEAAEVKHRGNLRHVEQSFREQIELLEKVHREELDRLKVRHERDRDRMGAEHEAAIAELENSIRTEQELTVALEHSELQARFDDASQQQARSLAVELEEMRAIIDAFNSVGEGERSSSLLGELSGEPTGADEAAEKNSALLLEIAEELDRPGGSTADAANESLEPVPGGTTS